MKKIIFWILTFLWIWLSFCSADFFVGRVSFAFGSPIPFWWLAETYYNNTYWDYNPIDWINTLYSWDSVLICFSDSYPSASIKDSSNNVVCDFSNYSCCTFSQWQYFDWNLWNFILYITNNWWWWSSTSDIDVYYNNWNSVENITCDWVQAIQINWLSTITSTNTFTPYFNISYKDEDNQSLIESYSKDILYLENWQFKKTYTWNNDWILTVQWNSENSFSWYLPTFDITWWINEVSESWNIFNNFAENSVKFTLSNIPSYIQYVILLFILFFILGFIRKFRRK